MAEPLRCPYCGSIEIHGNVCFWCNNPVTDDVPDEQDTNKSERKEHFMKIELKFSDLTYEEAERLLKFADSASIEGKAAISEAQSFHPVPAVPGVPAAPVVPTAVMPAAPSPARLFALPGIAAPTVPSAPPPAAPLPTAVKAYTADELAVAARPIAEAGKQQELINLIHTFMVTDASGATRPAASIRDLTPEQYPAFANGLRQLGGRI